MRSEKTADVVPESHHRTSNEAARQQTPAPTYEAAKKAAAERFEQGQRERAQARTAGEATLPAAEQKRLALTRELTARDSKLTPEERATKTRELRELVAAGATAEEREAYATAPLSEKRQAFDLSDPDLPKPWLEDYQGFTDWEDSFLILAREHGMESRTVRDLRAAAIELGQVVGERGKPATDEEVNRVLDRYGVSAAARPALVKLWRAIEGGDAEP
jgi:hypothetical protein